MAKQIKNSYNKKSDCKKSEHEELCDLDNKFLSSILRMSDKKMHNILLKLQEQDDFIKALEQAERDPSPYPNHELYQQLFYEETGWFYPDCDYPPENKK
jgi:hypothetical protein